MLKKVILMSLILGFSFSHVHAKNYYKWVDSKGNVTYSSKPPPTGAKQQKIDTIRSLGTPPAPQRAYMPKPSPSNSTNYSAQQPSQTNQTYNAPRQPERSAEDEALRQKIIKEASTPYKGSKGLTANQLNTLAAMSGVEVPANNSSSSYSVPATPKTPSTITNCDSSGCWGNDGTRYNKGAGSTYFPSTGGSCQNIGGQMQCN